ncbi:hypothetical protein NDU88_008872 [Pleurodeles waltl]|uniref:Uncharacterized protein n=1 Tax=Pleurodeles waltl TaxID=8319 RepID=A0AAV7N9N5_PLEWA|nr:hypothetical protein NDU88_008872 [Pleurodeles waltl]
MRTARESNTEVVGHGQRRTRRERAKRGLWVRGRESYGEREQHGDCGSGAETQMARESNMETVGQGQRRTL